MFVLIFFNDIKGKNSACIQQKKAKVRCLPVGQVIRIEYRSLKFFRYTSRDNIEKFLQELNISSADISVSMSHNEFHRNCFCDPLA